MHLIVHSAWKEGDKSVYLLWLMREFLFHKRSQRKVFQRPTEFWRSPASAAVYSGKLEQNTAATPYGQDRVGLSPLKNEGLGYLI